jgi:hypothetical protein
MVTNFYSVQVKYENGDLYNTLHEICYQLIVLLALVILDKAGS